MKKITLVLVALAFAAAMATAEDVTFSVSGSADIEWGFEGQLIDNSGSFLGDIATGDFYSAADGDLVNSSAPAFTFTMSVEDADGNVVVEAAAEEIALDDVNTEFVWEEEFASAFDYISFPNVVPGILGITLASDDTLDPSYAPSGSSSANERILIDITPIDQLEAQVGLLIKPDNALTTTLYSAAEGDLLEDAVVDLTGDVVFPTDPETAGTLTLPSSWQTGTYLSWAISLEATFTQAIGEDGEISVGLGTVIDSAFTNGTYVPDFELADVVGYDKYYTPFVESTMNDAMTAALLAEVYGPITVNPLTMKQMDPSSFGSTDDAKMLRTNEVLGRATIPVGVGVTAEFGDLSAAVDFQMVLTEGKDTDNYTGIIDVNELDKSTFDYANYAMPMYAAVDVGYEMAMGDMTITPGLNFKYSSDFWKWWFDAADDEVWEYKGDVSGADWVGRPMSLDAGVDVEGIAGMIDVSVSASVALGDGVGNHGYGVLVASDPLGVGVGSFTVTKDADGVQTIDFDNTVADMINFYYLQPAAAGSDTNFWNADGVDADSATDGMNNQWFGAASASAMGIEVGITVAPIAGLTIMNTTNYDVDNLGIGMDLEEGTLFGTPLSILANETNVEYDWMVGEAVAFTLFGNFTYTSESYFVEDGKKYIGLRSTSETVSPDVYEFAYSEVPSKATFDYQVGVRCSVGL